MSQLSEWNLIGTGVTLGLVHVLAGPDHLSALAALSVGTSYKAFILGVRWGLGHSAGLVSVAIVFILLKGDLNLRAIGRYCDFFVGLFMILLGCYGIVSALKIYEEKRKKRNPDRDIELSPMIATGSGKESPKLISRSSYEILQALEEEHSHIPAECAACTLIDVHDPVTQRYLSFGIGLLHGIAGPGGILGVIPAVEMQKWTSSFLYLGSFILASTLSMGTFAALYGEVTRRLGTATENMEFILNVFSSSLSIVVGTIWLVLSLMGKLDEIFH